MRRAKIVCTIGPAVQSSEKIASLISRAIREGGDDAKASEIRNEVHALTTNFPVY